MRARLLHALAFAAVLVALFSVHDARAYPWMIRHDYTACAQCHVDPSGSGPLNAYGRGMGEVLLKTHYGPQTEDDALEPGRGAKFLWGLVPLPDSLDFGGSFRVMELFQKTGFVPATHQFIFMQADVNATVQLDRWVASGSVGYEPEGGLHAAITRNPNDNLVSRFHWVGYRLDENSTMLLRAGRMALPFGIRDVVHTLSVRTTTRTNNDDQQQDGIAFSYSGTGLRAEAMLILGNYQIRPDAFRERGYSAYAEWAPMTSLALGASSRIAHVNADDELLHPAWRHAHGVFGRWSIPSSPIVLMSEVDYVIDSLKNLPRNQGLTSMAQVDAELVQGLHYQLTGEAYDFGPSSTPFSYSAWASLLWFFASHADVRLDGIYESIGSPGGRVGVTLLLAQAHLYL